MTDYHAQHVAIAGFAGENRAAAQWFAGRGARITVLDHNPETTVDAEYDSVLGPDAFSDLGRYDLVVRTPGMHPKHTAAAAGRVTTTTQLFLDAYRDQTIGITGTKGKGTTATLLKKMFRCARQPVILGGNVGVPLMSFYDDVQPDDVVVLELSSFQLIDATTSPHIAGVLMVEDEHLDWHTDRDEYLTAKAQITAHQLPDDILVHHPSSPMTLQIVQHSTAGTQQEFMSGLSLHISGQDVFFADHQLLTQGDVGLRGEHNLENIAAAASCFWQMSTLPAAQKIAALRTAIAEFHGLEHRLEYVTTAKDIEFFNDSFATTPSSAAAGLKAFAGQRPVTIIAGGSDKHVDLTPLADDIATHAAYAVLIGDTAQAIAELLKRRNYTAFEVHQQGTMHEFVERAIDQSDPGSVILLSPGCASFGLFENYKQRGHLFKQAALALAD